ncbi:hypothetical protein [Brevibacillus laterosporus]|uniref:hypothetical protein n=1 Tax=Brevibacillus laterosporus TaxID=1465 RepID=UPI000E6D1750|nr:hypothetical protein [Brevibacillus laterosporus]AYB38316.1 hypothetical protein D5F52_08625 [Brevibacillus laterosporus]MBM7110331.1 hypothetical protein [Brevibacillus laterosporus]
MTVAESLNFNGLIFKNYIGRRGFNYSKFSGILIGAEHFYVITDGIRDAFFSVIQERRNPDGTIDTITGQKTLHWREQDTSLSLICNGKVTTAYTMYTVDEVDYLVGWGKSTKYLYRWRVDNTGWLRDRESFQVVDSTDWYNGRAGWDGDKYVYFYSSKDSSLYRWDVTAPTKQVEFIIKLKDNQQMAGNVGSGLLVKNNKVYMGAGADSVNLMLMAWDLKTGDCLGDLKGSDLTNKGFFTSNGTSGTIQLSAVTNVAYRMYYGGKQYIDQYSVLPDVIGDIQTNSPIHHQDVDMRVDFIKPDGFGEEVDQVKYRVLVNGVKVYPNEEYTDITPTPFKAFINGIPNKHFDRIGANIVTIEVNNGSDFSFSKTATVVVTNTDPLITPRTATPTVTHKEDIWVEATAETEVGDFMSYRILINNKVYANWSDAIYTTPLHIRFMLRPNDLNIGNNSIKIEVKDNFKDNTNVSENTITVVKTNTKPNVEVSVKGQTLFISATDNDNDKVRFNVSINGNSFLPTSGMSPYYEVPFETSVDIPKQMIKLGQENMVSVSVQDIAGDIVTKEVTSSIEMSGLMFRDKNGSYYTTDTGELLKYLDIGSLKSGETSPAYQVWIENTTGYLMHGVTVTAIQGDLDSITEKIELSKENSSFTAVEYVSFPEPLQPKQTESFFFRIVCNDDAAGGGVFKLKVYGKPSLAY